MAKIDEKIKWANKIIGHDNVAPDQLLSHPDNWRVHPKYQQEALRGVINDIGFIKSVTVNQQTGRVVDGHLRVTLALRDGVATIPVEYVDLTEAEEAEALLTIDPIAALAVADKDNLQMLLNMIQTDDKEVQALLDRIEAKPIDFQAEWQGMPEFEQNSKEGIQLIVSFETMEDRQNFFDFIGQPCTDKTKSIWYPEMPIELRDQQRTKEGLVYNNES